MNASDLIGGLLKGGMSGSTGNRMQNAMGDQGLGGLGDLLGQVMGGQAGGGQGGLGGLLGQLSGGQGGAGGLGGMLGQLTGGQGGSAGGLGGMLGNLGGMAGNAMGDVGQTVKDSGNVGVGAIGALVGSLMGGGGGAVKGAIGGGAMALLGSLALKAFQNYQQSGGGLAEEQVPNSIRAMTDDNYVAQAEADSALILKAMISAAKADGTIDADEQQRLLGKLDEIGADANDRQTVIAELQAPLDMDGLVAAVNSPALAAQVYVASLLAIEVDTDAERHYLQQLAARMGLSGEQVASLHQAVGVAV